MDLFIIAIVGILFGIIFAVVSLVMKKSKWKILIIGITGLIIGTIAGYLLAPFILSFY